MKNEKKLHGFSYTKNIANFDAFRWNISLSAKLLFMKSVLKLWGKSERERTESFQS